MSWFNPPGVWSQRPARLRFGFFANNGDSSLAVFTTRQTFEPVLILKYHSGGASDIGEICRSPQITQTSCRPAAYSCTRSSRKYSKWPSYVGGPLHDRAAHLPFKSI